MNIQPGYRSPPLLHHYSHYLYPRFTLVILKSPWWRHGHWRNILFLSSFSFFMNTSVQTPHTHIHTHSHTFSMPAIYSEVITLVNDANVELEPINTADMTNSISLSTHMHTHTYLHKQICQSVYMWVAPRRQLRGLQRQYKCRQLCVYLCVFWMHTVMINFFWRNEKLTFSVTSCAALLCECACGLSYTLCFCIWTMHTFLCGILAFVW